MGEQDPQLVKRARILEAAFSTFSKYGFRRTSMADIAEEAGMSRAALYLCFKNKEDIVRQLTVTFFQAAADRIARELIPGGDPMQVIPAVFAAKSGPMAEAMLTSPHAQEFMDTGSRLALEEKEQGTAELRRLLAGWLSAEEAAARIDLSGFGADAESLAATMLNALEGQFYSGPSLKDYEVAAHQLGLMFGTALRTSSS